MVILFSGRHFFFWYCFNSSISTDALYSWNFCYSASLWYPVHIRWDALSCCAPLHQTAGGDPPLLTPTASTIVMSEKTCCLTGGKSASPILCFCSVTQVSACLLARFYKIPAAPAGKLIGLTALSRGNSQKRIHFRMMQILFTSSSKQLFTNYSTGSHISGCLNRRKCVYCVLPTEINRKKCWWNGCLTPGTCSPLPKGATVTRLGKDFLAPKCICLHPLRLK